MSKTRELSVQHEDDSDEDQDDELAQSLSTNMKIHNRKISCKSSPCDIRRVDVCSSPVLEVSVNGKISKFTLDSGAEANVILEQECNRLGLHISPTSQGATQGDGKTPLNTIGEVHFTASRGHHKLVFSGLVVKQLVTPALAGMPFHRINHIQINYSLNYILLEDCCKIDFNPEKQSKRKPNMRALRIARHTQGWKILHFP